jgi:hypothetical protein
MGKADVYVFYDYGKPTIDSLLKAMEKSRIEQNQYKKFISKKWNGNSLEDNHRSNHSNISNTILDAHEDIIKLIIGVSIAKNGILKIFGAHTFLMCIIEPYSDTRNWQLDVMLDASGHYGVPQYRHTNTDIVVPNSPTTISIDNYRRYWFRRKKELLYTYSYIIDKSVGQTIRSLIRNNEKRSTLSCASKAMYVLERTGLFPKIKTSSYPIDLKKYCDNFDPANKNIMDLLEKSSYDLEIYP